jgi:high-affinity nickel-transport protein
VIQALVVAAVFVVGMLVVDGVNGVWISRLIRRADRTAVVASRVMALTIAGLSLAVGLFTVVKVFVPAVDAWTEGREWLVGSTVVFATLGAFAIAMRAARKTLALSKS